MNKVEADRTFIDVCEEMARKLTTLSDAVAFKGKKVDWWDVGKLEKMQEELTKFAEEITEK